MSYHDSVAVFAALAADLQQEPDEEPTARAVVVRMRELVPEADHVSLAGRTSRGVLATLACTDDVGAALDDLQRSLREGPAVVALASGGWARSGDVAHDRRWPAWGAAAAGRGVCSSLSIAVPFGDEPFAVISLHSKDSGRFAGRELVDRARLYAAHATTAIAAARRATTLRAAVDSRHVIGMAQGIAMERFGIDRQQSFELLRRLSSTSNTKLREVAQQVVETREFPHEREGQSVD